MEGLNIWHASLDTDFEMAKSLHFVINAGLEKNPDPEDVRLALEGWKLASGIISGRKADIVVLDEINCAMDFGLLPVGEVLEAIRTKPDGMELVLTGRGAPPEIIEAADLVTEMREIRHYYAKGVDARVGVER